MSLYGGRCLQPHVLVLGGEMGEQDVFSVISGPVTEQVRPNLKLTMVTALTSDMEIPCSLIHIFLLLCSSRAQTGAGLGFEFSFPCPLLIAP